MASPVFISHSHEDPAAYTRLRNALNKSEIALWGADQLTVGSPLAEGLRDAIKKCEVCIFLATPRSLKSLWCLAELGAFWGAGKRVIVFQNEASAREKKMPPQFKGNLHTADLTRVISAVRKMEEQRAEQERDALEVTFGKMEIRVSLGRIEAEAVAGAESALIALPANEYFDDECINDARSALGAYVGRHFGDRVAEIQQLVRDRLQGERSQEALKTPLCRAPAYPLGTCVFLDRPLGSSCRLVLVAVTTQRADAGLSATARSVFDAVASIQRVMANNRLTHVVVPVLGSGHGGLNAEVSLACMLIAFGELSVNRSGSAIRKVDILVYRRNSATKPAISPASVRRALGLVESFVRG